MDDSEIQALDSLESSHWWYQNRRRVLYRALRALPKSSSILDLGSASGSNTLFMQKVGFPFVASVEFSNFGCELQRKKGIDVIQADACNLPFESKSYDFVVCMDVIEHIEHDTYALNEICRVLKEEGEALISVPEDMNLWSNHDIAVGHFRRYSKKELISKVQQCGLQPKVVFSSHIALKPLIRFFRKFSKGSDLKPVHPILNFILEQVCLV